MACNKYEDFCKPALLKPTIMFQMLFLKGLPFFQFIWDISRLSHNCSQGVNAKKWLKGFPTGKYWSQDVSRTSPSNFPRTSPKDPIWPSRRRPNLMSRGRPEMTFRGRLNLTLKGRSWEVHSERPQDVLRTSPRGPWGTQTWMSKIFF